MSANKRHKSRELIYAKSGGEDEKLMKTFVEVDCATYIKNLIIYIFADDSRARQGRI